MKITLTQVIFAGFSLILFSALIGSALIRACGDHCGERGFWKSTKIGLIVLGSIGMIFLLFWLANKIVLFTL